MFALQHRGKTDLSSKCVTALLLWTIVGNTVVQLTTGYLDINQYCRAFDSNFRPIICLIKNGTSTPPPNHNPHPSTHPPPAPPPYPILQPDYTDYDDDDDDECSCEVRCAPRIVNQRSLLPLVYLKRPKRTSKSSSSYRCRSCGTECPVSTSRPPTCNCAVPTAKAECSCSATCAMFRSGVMFRSGPWSRRPPIMPFFFPHRTEDEDANCIISVTALEDWRLGEERPPYTCECQRSKEAQSSRKPDFVCVCQRAAES